MVGSSLPGGAACGTAATALRRDPERSTLHCLVVSVEHPAQLEPAIRQRLHPDRSFPPSPAGRQACGGARLQRGHALLSDLTRRTHGAHTRPPPPRLAHVSAQDASENGNSPWADGSLQSKHNEGSPRSIRRVAPCSCTPRCAGVFSSSPMHTCSASSLRNQEASRMSLRGDDGVPLRCVSSATDDGQLKLTPIDRAGVRLTTRWMAMGAMISRSPGRRTCAAPPVNGWIGSSGRRADPASRELPSASRLASVGGHTSTSLVPWC